MSDILNVQGTEIRFLEKENRQYICLTDIATRFGDAQLITDWLKNKNTLEFIKVWETLNNPEFDQVAFNSLLAQAGTNRFRVAIKDLKAMHSKGIFASPGRYGGTFGDKDIAIEFCSWLSPEFKLYLITELQRLKALENSEISFERSVRRIVAKANYRIHTDAVKEKLIPPNLDKMKSRFVYADEADVLNVALFGMTAKEWRRTHPDAKGNIRDDNELCTVEHLIVLNNLESQNALLIREGIPREKRAIMLNQEAIRQLRTLVDNPSIKTLAPSKLLLGEEKQ